MRLIILAIIALIATQSHAGAQGAQTQQCAADVPYGLPTFTAAPAEHILCRTGYLTAVNDARLVPDWVAWILTPDSAMGCIPRHDQFAADPDLPKGHRATPEDYAASGYDQGHLTPAEDHASSIEEMRQSFYMSNMSPQRPELNRWEWEQLEASTRAWTMTHGALLIMDGPIYDGVPATIGPDHVAVPTRFWKVIYSAQDHAALAFIMANGSVPKGSLVPYAVSVAAVETAAGITIPWPVDLDKEIVTSPWLADLSGFTKAKQAKCHP